MRNAQSRVGGDGTSRPVSDLVQAGVLLPQDRVADHGCLRRMGEEIALVAPGEQRADQGSCSIAALVLSAS